MNGQAYMASRTAASFRRHLWRQHLGLIPRQDCTLEDASRHPTDAMRPAPHPNPDPARLDDEYERLVADPLSEEVEKLWKGQVRTRLRNAVMPGSSPGLSLF